MTGRRDVERKRRIKRRARMRLRRPRILGIDWGTFSYSVVGNPDSWEPRIHFIDEVSLPLTQEQIDLIQQRIKNNPKLYGAFRLG